ncbi:MAG: hypothetical protein C0613_08405 [Desulfobulbaceae bacterium]|nr:MAG: hypothetical protein C0613_08405 [Desulfobulbaceae bacterium]
MQATTKRFWTSKTFWTNILAIVAIVAQAQFGWVISPETNGYILAAVNTGLRLVTKEEISWGNE